MNHSPHLSTHTAERLRQLIVETPDFPIDGVLFRDLSRLLADSSAMDAVVSALCVPYGHGQKPTHIVGIESRGYIYGAAMATLLGVGFVPVRKPGKIPPGSFDEESYATEYSTARLQLQHGLIKAGDRVVVCDDLIATGGSAGAAATLVRRAGGVVAGFAFVIELEACAGRSTLRGTDIHSLFTF